VSKEGMICLAQFGSSEPLACEIGMSSTSNTTLYEKPKTLLTGMDSSIIGHFHGTPRRIKALETEAERLELTHLTAWNESINGNPVGCFLYALDTLSKIKTIDESYEATPEKDAKITLTDIEFKQTATDSSSAYTAERRQGIQNYWSQRNILFACTADTAHQNRDLLWCSPESLPTLLPQFREPMIVVGQGHQRNMLSWADNARYTMHWYCAGKFIPITLTSGFINKGFLAELARRSAHICAGCA
jgi:hypothetical protein